MVLRDPHREGGAERHDILLVVIGHDVLWPRDRTFEQSQIAKLKGFAGVRDDGAIKLDQVVSIDPSNTAHSARRAMTFG